MASVDIQLDDDPVVISEPVVAEREYVLPVDETWDLLCHPTVLDRWIGLDAQIDARSGRSMSVVHRNQLGDRTAAVIRASAVNERRCKLVVSGSVESGEHWNRVLEAAQTLIGQVQRRRSNVRQAVVVVHGIGEQRPGASLQQLIDSGVIEGGPGTPKLWVKPDTFSDHFELHRVRLKQSHTHDLPATDLFEFYWAHLIQDTSVVQVVAWLRRILLRRNVPRPLQFTHGLGVFLAAAAAAVFSLSLLALDSVAGRVIALVAVVAGVAWRVFGRRMAVHYVGDAARYLQPEPSNVASRNTVRSAGVDLVESLHRSGDYDRIVVVGHSLGSVIAMDVIKICWLNMHKRHLNPAAAQAKPELPSLERALGSDGLSFEKFRELQHNAWRRQRINTQPWLVTDFITLGSPLTYADFLMADSRSDFDQAKHDRRVPTAPPAAETEKGSGNTRVSYDKPFTRADGQTGTMMVYHHAAPFAVTRWTNLYFESTAGGLKGDVVGGPLSPNFGAWVHDVPLKPPKGHFAHTSYLRSTGASSPHIDALRCALQLRCRDSLLSLSRRIPGHSFLQQEQDN